MVRPSRRADDRGIGLKDQNDDHTARSSIGARCCRWWQRSPTRPIQSPRSTQQEVRGRSEVPLGTNNEKVNLPAKPVAVPLTRAERAERSRCRERERQERLSAFREQYDNEGMYQKLARPGEAPMAGMSIEIPLAVDSCDAAEFKVRGSSYGSRKASSSSYFSPGKDKKKECSAPAMFDFVGADCVVSEDGLMHHFGSKVVLPWCCHSAPAKNGEEQTPPPPRAPGPLGEALPRYLEDRKGAAVPAFIIFNIGAPVDPPMKQESMFPTYPISSGSKGQHVANHVFYFRLTEATCDQLKLIDAEEEENERRAEDQAASRDKAADPAAAEFEEGRGAVEPFAAAEPKKKPSSVISPPPASGQRVAPPSEPQPERRYSLPGAGWTVGEEIEDVPRRRTVDGGGLPDVVALEMAGSRMAGAEGESNEATLFSDGLNWALDSWGFFAPEESTRASGGDHDASRAGSNGAAGQAEQETGGQQPSGELGALGEHPLASQTAQSGLVETGGGPSPPVEDPKSVSEMKEDASKASSVSGGVRLLHRWCRDCLDDAEVAGQLKFLGRGLNLEETDCPAIAYAYNGTPMLISDYAITEPSTSFAPSLSGRRSRSAVESNAELSEAAATAAAAHNASSLSASPTFEVSPSNPGGRLFNNLKRGMRPGICEIYRGPNYIEVDLDVAKWYGYIAQRTIAWGIASQVKFQGAFLLEGRTLEELPERVLGCVSINQWPVGKAPMAKEYFARSKQMRQQQKKLQEMLQEPALV